MEGFLKWFISFIETVVGVVWNAVYAAFTGIVTVFNIPKHIATLKVHGRNFSYAEWALSYVSFALVILFFVTVIFMIFRGLFRYIRFRRISAGKLDAFEEISNLRREVARLTKDKERLMSLQTGSVAASSETVNDMLLSAAAEAGFEGMDQYSTAIDLHAPEEQGGEGAEVGVEEESDAPKERFFRLKAVDEKYRSYTPPQYDDSPDLPRICDALRNFACSQLGLFYEKKTVRLMIAGMASTKLLILQGISGTGKTSLPYAVGKFLQNDSTIASVQPSWRDRAELFGYFNEFTKKFNETEVLRRIYEASYNDDINMIILDEMNIARVEYYFAEMLSILEMPDPTEWKIELVPSAWDTDPEHLPDGKLSIPQNVWYVGTANNDDSTSSITDKVYDRAMVINLDSKGVPFEAPETPPMQISSSHLFSLFAKAIKEHPVSHVMLNAIADLDSYVIAHFRIAFGNRIMKQLNAFVPVFVACGGTEIEAVDYLLATKVIRKFEALNLSLIYDELEGLVDYFDNHFGEGAMQECIAYLRRLQKML